MGSQSRCSTILEQKSLLPNKLFPSAGLKKFRSATGHPIKATFSFDWTTTAAPFLSGGFGLRPRVYQWYTVPSLVDSSDARTSANIRLLARCLIDELSILRTRLHPAQTTQLGSQQAWFAFLLQMRKRLPPSRRRVRWHRYVLLSSHCAAESRSCNSCPRSSAEQIWQPAHILRLVPCTGIRQRLVWLSG